LQTSSAIEIVIKFLENRQTIFSTQKWQTLRKTSSGVFLHPIAARLAATGRRNTLLNSYVAVSRTQKTSSCLFKRANFPQYFDCLCKRIFNCCNVLMWS